eukprot:TRINITY_DN31845_c0_g1_i1.p1 TRINITY_DN31845_c0_g1~~TRINITY_DN31845_c0_g1_i1.p1  ORF type:complete len:167 (+),score=57.23 TRINITY_DN31845_c0_g1_i1:69-569(+)
MGLLNREEELDVLRAEVALQEEKVRGMKEAQKVRQKLVASMLSAIREVGESRIGIEKVMAPEDGDKDKEQEEYTEDGTDAFDSYEPNSDSEEQISTVTLPQHCTHTTATEFLTSQFASNYVLSITAYGKAAAVLSSIVTQPGYTVKKLQTTLHGGEGGLVVVLMET